MRGPYKYMAARMLQESPTAMYIHCCAHVLNLCIVSCFHSMASIRNAFFVLQSIYNFIKSLTKSQLVFERIQKSSKSFHGGATADELVALNQCVHYWTFGKTLAALEEILEIDHDVGGQANALKKKYGRF
ncbi:hypothetical protein QYM36_001133 [Artemia franciscana]|uniref:Uncharacterized protein n=1 Tax=Artemia franciscana TaxID=6661 RepID=A0AA88IIF9_ARTSF|nr:hypothetical protein QYM36_001133 [Artemia franciscana]